MDKNSVLDEIFNNDPFGLLNVKSNGSSARNADERLIESFQEINDFFEKNNREPLQNGGIQEHRLYSRLYGLRENPVKAELVQEYDRFGLLRFTKKEINSLDDLLNEDALGLLDDDDTGLFDLVHVKRDFERERAETDFVARRKPCKDFGKYEDRFREVQQDLKANKRKIIDFKLDNLREGSYYIHNGILFLVEKINITHKEHYRKDGTRVREDGRTRCIFENGTESNMLKRSVEKILYANGKAVSENADKVNETFLEKFGNITEEDKEAGFIYILKSKSEKPEIKTIQHLYKIGYSTIPVEERIKNCSQEPTYLMADVRIVMTYKCYNMNPQKLEQLLHNFFGKSCLNIDVFDRNGNRHTPREWFIAPLDIIDQAIQFIISGEIVKYKYNAENESLISK